MESPSDDISKQVGEVRLALAHAAKREIELTAMVFAQRDFLLTMLEQNPTPGLKTEQVQASLEQATARHRQKLWIRFEDENPALAAWLSEGESFD